MKINFYFILRTCFLLTALILVFPNKIREVPFATLGLFSIIFYFKEKLYKKKDILFFLYFLVLTFSLIYSNNLKYGFRYLEAQLPFFYLPFAYLVFIRREILNKESIKKWIFFFNLSNVLFLILFVFYFLIQSQEVSYNNIRTSFDTMPFLGVHPIYLSIIAVLSIFSNFYSQNKSRFLQYFFISINLVLLVMTGVRATLLFFPIIITAFFLFSKTSLYYKIKICLLIFSLFFCFTIFNKDFTKRLSEISNPQTYSQLNLHNSASIRSSVWDCALTQAKQSNPIIGEGLGDTRGLLQDCYDSQYPELNKYYNTHNQYLSIYISIGVIGLLTIAIFLYRVSRSVSIQNKKYFSFTLIFYLYMFIFENVLERKYGVLIFLTFLLFIFNNNQKDNIRLHEE